MVYRVNWSQVHGFTNSEHLMITSWLKLASSSSESSPDRALPTAESLQRVPEPAVGCCHHLMLASLVRARFQDCSISSNSDRENDLRVHELALRGDVMGLHRLLATEKSHVSVNVKDALGCTPLRLAATEGHAKIVECLIEYGADVNLADVKAQTPLFAAVKKGHEACARILLKNGASPLGPEPGQFINPLYTAIMNGYSQLVQLLLEYSPEVIHSPCQQRYVPHILGMAVVYGQMECLQLLLAAGADPDLEGREFPMPSLYRLAVHHCASPEYILLLYEFGANLYLRMNNERYPPLIIPDDHQKSLLQLMQQLKETPRSLKSICRLLIRRTLGHQRLRKIGTLPLPAPLCAYLAHKI